MGPKKGKKTKQQIEEERLAKEEEDRKTHEAELKKKSEEEEKQRQEDLRIRAERKAFRESELARLHEEHAKFVDEEESRLLQMAAEEAAEEANVAWLKYRDPSDEPDPESERDMNTFISQSSESSSSDFKGALDIVSKIKRVSVSIEDILSDSITNKDLSTAGRCQQYFQRFHEMAVEKLDTATAHMLRFVEDQLNDKYEIQIEDSSDGIAIGIWSSYHDIRPIRKSVQFESINFQIDIPKQILAHDARFIHRIIRLPIDKFSSSAYLPSSIASGTSPSGKYVLGDIVVMDLLFPPPQPHTIRAKKWTLRDRSALSLNLRRSAYPSSVACRCVFKVPDEIIMSDDVRVALWNEETNDWTEDGISDYQYSDTNRLVQFYVTVVGVIALVRDRASDLPYRKWSLTALHIPVKGASAHSTASATYERQARLTVQTQRHELVIDVVGTKCKLVKPTLKQLSDLVGVEMSPGRLLYKLQKRGINVMPTDTDCTKVESVKPKELDVEQEVLANISRCCSTCDFKSSPWNQQLSKDEIGILVRESTAYTGAVEAYDYECVLAERDTVSTSHKHAPEIGVMPGAGVKFTLVVGNEYESRRNFSVVPRANEIPRLELGVSIRSRLTPEGSSRIARSNALFAKTITKLLQLMKPFSLN